MKILIIDTASKQSQAVLVDGKNTQSVELVGNIHSQTLMVGIDSLLKSNGLSLTDIDYLGCTIGPGSFTGIRVGLATVKAFSYAAQKQIAVVNTLDALAYNVINADGDFVALIDAKHGNCYAACYDKNLSCTVQPCFLSYGQVKELYQNLSFVGDGLYDGKKLQTSGNGLVSAIKAKIANNQFCADPTPLYIRQSQAELQLKQGDKNG